MRYSTIVVSCLSVCSTSLAAPAPAAAPSPAPTAPTRLEGRDPKLLGQVVSNVDSVVSDIVSGSLTGDAGWSSIKSAISTATATSTQTNTASAISALSSIHAAQPSANFFEYVTSLVVNGLTKNSVAEVLDFVAGALDGENSMSNVNSHEPNSTVYPQKSCGDAPYSLDESALRAAIYIPSTFTYGKVPPVILMPGTGNTGYITFQGNFVKLLTGTDYADPVWINVPGYLLADAQVNAEYIAYAINYISGITNRNVSVIAWSQGNIDTQWAFKYWPSTRLVTSNHIAMSPDYAGTTFVALICPGNLLCNPSVYQQRYLSQSNFITTMRSSHGDSAYVPTTVVYSGLFDEIVEPQQGTGASAYLLDARKVGVTNNEVQTICPAQPAGSFYTHEGVLYNPIAFALARDALVNGGPGRVDRLDNLHELCGQYLPTGLNLGDLLLTENAAVVALSAILLGGKVAAEPAISAYATASAASAKSTCSSSS